MLSQFVIRRHPRTSPDASTRRGISGIASPSTAGHTTDTRRRCRKYSRQRGKHSSTYPRFAAPNRMRDSECGACHCAAWAVREPSTQAVGARCACPVIHAARFQGTPRRAPTGPSRSGRRRGTLRVPVSRATRFQSMPRLAPTSPSRSGRRRNPTTRRRETP